MNTRFSALLVLFSALVGVPAAAQGLADRCKPLKMKVPGGASDATTRAYAKAIADVSGLSVIVDYRPGASAMMGTPGPSRHRDR